jgi:hypothetical protein
VNELLLLDAGAAWEVEGDADNRRQECLDQLSGGILTSSIARADQWRPT